MTFFQLKGLFSEFWTSLKPKLTKKLFLRLFIFYIAGGAVFMAKCLGVQGLFLPALCAALPPLFAVFAVLGGISAAMIWGLNAVSLASGLAAMGVVFAELWLIERNTRSFNIVLPLAGGISLQLGLFLAEISVNSSFWSVFATILPSFVCFLLVWASVSTFKTPALLDLKAAKKHLLAALLAALVCTCSQVGILGVTLGGILYIFLVALLVSYAESQTAFMFAIILYFGILFNNNSAENIFLCGILMAFLTFLPKICKSKIWVSVCILAISCGCQFFGNGGFSLPVSAVIATALYIAFPKKQIADFEALKPQPAPKAEPAEAPKPQFEFLCGTSKIAKDENGVSGDEILTFGTAGKQYALISDGMGTGEQALAVSKRLTKILTKLLKFGIAPETALAICSDCLKDSGHEEAFATADLLEFNTASGELKFYKCGGAKSFCFTEKSVTAVPCGGYPLGIMENAEMQKTELDFSGGGKVVMCSDGGEGLNTFELRKIIFSQEKQNCADAAAGISRAVLGLKNEKNRDDISVAVISIEKIANF